MKRGQRGKIRKGEKKKLPEEPDEKEEGGKKNTKRVTGLTPLESGVSRRFQ